MRDAQRLEGLKPYDPNFIAANVLLNSNENPDDVPPAVREAIAARLSQLPFNRYPQPSSDALRGLIAQNLATIAQPLHDPSSAAVADFPMYGPDSIVVGNGGDELLYYTYLAFGGPGNAVLLAPPSFSVYQIDAHLTGTPVVSIARDSAFGVPEQEFIQRAAQDDINLVMLTSPNNPTGDLLPNDFIRQLCASTQALVVVDEAYGEFAGRTCLPLVEEFPNLAVLRTFSKAYALAGVRLGYIVAHPSVVDRYLMVRQPYSVNVASQAIGEEVVLNHQLYAPIVRSIVMRRNDLASRLATLPGVEVFPSSSNFILIRVKGAHGIWQRMAYEDGVLVRDFSGEPALADCLRITVGTEEENQKLLDALVNAMLKGGLS